MTRFSDSYSIARPTGVCAATGEPLVPGEACVATLSEAEEHDGFERQDYSGKAWAAGTRPERLFSFWRTTVQPPNEQRKLLVDDEVILDLFMRLAEDDRPQRVAFRFVLGLILMRKRQLRFVGRRGEGENEQWLMRRRGADPDDPPIELRNPHLTDDDVRDLTTELGEILRGEF